MSTNSKKYGGNVQAFPFFLIAPMAAKDVSLPLDEFDRYDVDGNLVGQYDIGTLPGRELAVSKDETYFIVGLNVSELDNEHTSVKQTMINNGFMLGGKEFDNGEDFRFWLVSNVAYLETWLSVSPHNKESVYEDGV